MRGSGRRRGISRVAFFLLTLALVASGCGQRGQGAETDPEKGSDAELLNAALSQELTALDAYTRGVSRMSESLNAMRRQFRAHEQEYVDAITKAIRGLGGETEAESVELDFAEIADETDFVELLYELESAAFAAYLDAVPRLHTEAPRKLAASLAAGHAQHLVLLRQALGARSAESVPEAFESGEEPTPVGAKLDRGGTPPGAAKPSGGR